MSCGPYMLLCVFNYSHTMHNDHFPYCDSSSTLIFKVPDNLSGMRALNLLLMSPT